LAFGDAAELVSEPALEVVCVREDRGRRRGQDRRGLVVDVDDSRGDQPAALGEDEVRCYPHSSLGLCILKKKGLKPYMRAKRMPARM
jgi:hypothetical protein